MNFLKMHNIVSSIINQQYNFSTIKRYDHVIERLQCRENDEHQRLFEDESSELYNIDTPIFSCKFALKKGYTQYLALANEDGKLAVLNTEENGQRFGTWAHANAIFDIAWPYNSMKLATASGDHTAKLFDITNCQIRHERSFYGHTRSVKTICYRRDDPNIFATGGRDGHIMIWDTRSEIHCTIGKPDRQLRNAHFFINPVIRPYKRVFYKNSSPSFVGSKSVTSLVFRDDNSLISCAAGDGLIKMWDLRKTYQNCKDKPVPKCIIAYPGERAKSGFSNLIVDKDFTKLYANCLDNTIYCYNVMTFNATPVMKYTGHQNNTFYVKSSLSSDGNYLISGSSDENAYIWKTDCSLPYIRLVGHKAEVTSVAWCQKPLPVIVTCSDDMRHKIWRVGKDNSPDNWHYIRRGQAEVLHSFSFPKKPKLKRIRCDSDNVSHVTKKFIVQSQKCLKVENEAVFCENVPTNSSSEMTQANNLSLPSEAESITDGSSESRCSQSQIPKKWNESDIRCDSPTLNLPNFVVDGIAPHVSQSPIKKRDIDWLTKMRKDNSFRKELLQTCNQTTPLKSIKTDSPSKSGDSKKQDNGSSPQTSLLKYFKIKNNKTENLSSAKSSGYRFMTSSQSTT